MRDQAARGTAKPLVEVSAPPPLVYGETWIGRMEITRLNLSVIVAEGTDEATLRRSSGHIIGTELPGKPGNVGIAGHRDTLFRPLRNIQRNDIITLTTVGGDYRYRVVSTKIVSPYDVAVLNPDGTEVLTLVTSLSVLLYWSRPRSIHCSGRKGFGIVNVQNEHTGSRNRVMRLTVTHNTVYRYDLPVHQEPTFSGCDRA